MKKAFSIVFILAEMCFLLLAVHTYVDTRQPKSAQVTDFTAVQWNEEDPFWVPMAAEKKSAEKPSDSLLTRFQTLTAKAKARITEIVSEKAPYYHLSVQAGKRWERFIGKNATTANAGTAEPDTLADGVILELEDRYFTFLPPLGSDPDGVAASNLESFSDFAQWLEAEGIPFVYMEPPHINIAQAPGFAKYNGVYSTAVEDYCSYIQGAVRSAPVYYLDILDCYPEMEDNILSYFFRTDHHWLPQTGLMACAALADCLNERYGFSCDSALYALDEYDMSKTTTWLGSIGRKLTYAYCEPEEITFLTPLYDSNLTVYHEKQGGFLTGSIAETLFDAQRMQNLSEYNTAAYHVYGYGDKPLIMVHNNQLEDGKRILVLKKSMADCMVPFLPMMAENVDVIDCRHYTGSVREFIEATKPDVVVMIYGSVTFLVAEAFDFG